MTPERKSRRNNDAKGGAKRDAGRRGCKTASTDDRPLKPPWAPPIIEGMATFTAVAEAMAVLGEGNPLLPSSMFAYLISEMNRDRARVFTMLADSLRSSMPQAEALEEIERLRSYEARMLAKKRKEMKSVHKTSKSAKRSQRMESLARS